MAKLYFITHPEVVIDPETLVSQWQLSDLGKKRAEFFAQAPWIPSLSVVYSSAELKAYQTAEIVTRKLHLPIHIQSKLGEIDRSSTGYVEKIELTKIVKDFFKHPDKPVKGWERAKDAQKRITKTVTDIISQYSDDNIAVFSHGMVGALLNSYFKNASIHQRYEQSQLGSYFVVETAEMKIIKDWTNIDEDHDHSSLKIIDRRIKDGDKPLPESNLE